MTVTATPGRFGQRSQVLVHARPVAIEPSAAASSVSALPLGVDLLLYQGDDFFLNLTVTNPDGTAADLTGYTAKSQLRVTADDVTVAATFTASIAGNVISLHLANIDSATLSGALVWDCQITSAGGLITTLAAGSVTMTAQVTRP